MSEGEFQLIAMEPVPRCLLCDVAGAPLYCGLEDRLFGVPGRFELARCPRCGLIWQHPRPTRESIDRCYEGYHTHAAPGGDIQPFRGLRGVIRRLVLGETYGYEQLRLRSWWAPLAGRLLAACPPIRSRAACQLGERFPRWAPEGRLLDVGSGAGTYLAVMRCFGWDTLGVEPDPEAAEAARLRYGIPVITGTLEQAALPTASFDAITMHHVIEHVHDPIGLLRECRRLLRPGGTLVAVTPNAAGLGHRLFGRDWRGLEPPRHLVLFTATTLRQAAQRAGLQVERCRSDAEYADSIYVQSREIQAGATGPAWRLKLAARSFRWIERIGGRLGWHAGEELVIVCRKEI